MKKRTSYGSANARKCYVGQKSVNIEFEAEEAQKLLRAIARAPKNITLTVIRERGRVVISAVQRSAA